jgi:hypothetical protein
MMHTPRRFAARLSLSLLCVSFLLASAAATTAAAPFDAVYNVTFDATWSAATHPQDFPPNPHFSGLIGGNHNDMVAFWEVGELASLGIQRMAEWGAKSPLDEEVEAAIAAGNAGAVISGGHIAVSPGSVSEIFVVSQDFPLVTLVTMIAPSPDWFVGVSGLSLFESGDWIEELVVELWAYDAGTDSGPSYASPNQPTVPHEPIYLKDDGPFTPGVPIGTFTFTLLSSTTTVPTAAALRIWTYPNPFNPRATIAYHLPEPGRLSVSVYDLRGRRVRVLEERNAAAGEGAVVWDGRNQDGREAAAGTYVVRVEAGRRATERKITLAK